MMSTRPSYSTDLTDAQWALIAPLLPQRRDARGAKEKHSRRELLNAILYLDRSGCGWELLPHDFPPYKTVYDYYRKLCRRGAWVPIVDHLRAQARQALGREAEPSLLIGDSQSVKTTEKGGQKATTAASR
jgi:putative transposase